MLLPAGLQNYISMVSVYTLLNILIVNTKIIKGKLSNIFISEVCIKLVALCINTLRTGVRYIRT